MGSRARCIAIRISSASVSPMPSAVQVHIGSWVLAEMNCMVTSIEYPRNICRRPVSAKLTIIVLSAFDGLTSFTWMYPFFRSNPEIMEAGLIDLIAPP